LHRTTPRLNQRSPDRKSAPPQTAVQFMIGDAALLTKPVATLRVIADGCAAVVDECIHAVPVKPKQPDCELTKVVAISADGKLSRPAQYVGCLQSQRRPISVHLPPPGYGSHAGMMSCLARLCQSHRLKRPH
jgi:hypothetical protein